MNINYHFSFQDTILVWHWHGMINTAFIIFLTLLNSFKSNSNPTMDPKHKGVKFLCDYKATQKRHLLTHLKSKHEGIKYPCDQCDHKATRKGNLLVHIKSKHEGIKYPCDQCEYKATEKSSLLRHLTVLQFSCVWVTQKWYSFPVIRLSWPIRGKDTSALQSFDKGQARWGWGYRLCQDNHWTLQTNSSLGLSPWRSRDICTPKYACPGESGQALDTTRESLDTLLIDRWPQSHLKQQVKS